MYVNQNSNSLELRDVGVYFIFDNSMFYMTNGDLMPLGGALFLIPLV